jgi:translation initiation factor eIF-2B subunit gamma
LDTALSRNPYLTSLPSRRPTVLAPHELNSSTGTAEIFRLEEVRRAIIGDFIVLPCDLVSELPGTTLLQEWMVHQSAFGGATGGIDKDTGQAIPMSVGGEMMGRRGALGLWYDTTGVNKIAGEETDFVMTVVSPETAAYSTVSDRKRLPEVAYTMPTDALNDKIDEKNPLRIQYRLLEKYGQSKIRRNMRDSHIYIFPFWALDYMQNEKFESIGEDVLGWWAKSTWQNGLAEKLRLNEILNANESRQPDDFKNLSANIYDEKNINVADYSTTRTLTSIPASKISVPQVEEPNRDVTVPPILAFFHESSDSLLVRRVDTRAALLAVSLLVARLPEARNLPKGEQISPLAHEIKTIPSGVAKQARIEERSCLIADTASAGDNCNIKESVIGAGCTIHPGARIIKCVLMDDVEVGENVSISGCILGPGSKLLGGPRTSKSKTDLRDCDVEASFEVPWGSKSSILDQNIAY